MPNFRIVYDLTNDHMFGGIIVEHLALWLYRRVFALRCEKQVHLMGSGDFITNGMTYEKQ